MSSVDPAEVKKDALTAKKLFPEKRLIVHFMQPHVPFVAPETDLEIDELNAWEAAMRGKISHEEVQEAYKENLVFVMGFVEDLVDDLDGKVAITSDHGNLLGEGGLYGHPHNHTVKPLREVPWDVRE